MINQRKDFNFGAIPPVGEITRVLLNIVFNVIENSGKSLLAYTFVDISMKSI